MPSVSSELAACAADPVVCAALGEALTYPAGDHVAHVSALRGAVRDSDPALAELLSVYLSEARVASVSTLQAHYTHAFDLAPLCSPYLSVHVFGIEAKERTALMLGLAMTYERIAFDAGGELTDHLSCVLRAAPRFEPDEWHELAALILARALPKMCRLLEDSANPYFHLLLAVARALRVEEAVEDVHLEACHG